MFRQKYRPAPRQWLVPCRQALAPAAGAADPARRHPLARAGHQRLANHLVHRLLTSGPSPAERKRWIVIAAVATLVSAIGVVGYLVTRPTHPSTPSTPASGQTVLPFTGIDFRLSPGGVALDTAGSVFVTSEGMFGRVVKLEAGSGNTAVLPFTGLYQPQGLALDPAGAMYVADFDNRVVKLMPGRTLRRCCRSAASITPRG